MAWLWSSWKEYIDYVHPVAFDSPGRAREAQRDPLFQTEHHLWEALKRLEDSRQSLHGLGFTGSDHDRPPDDSETIKKASRLVLEAVYAGEELLFYHKRLAKNDAAYGFSSQNDMLDHWDRYERSGRISHEIHQLMSDIDDLLQGYYDLNRAEEVFIVSDLDLPDHIEAEFRLSRNLFLVGLDEVGLLIAGRGLEAVLRRIAHVRKIELVSKGKTSPASESDFHDLIEVMYQLRWKVKGTRLIGSKTRSLLHYLRTIRNSNAHPVASENKTPISPRETAVVVAKTANRLWNEVTGSRAHLDPKTVQKTW